MEQRTSEQELDLMELLAKFYQTLKRNKLWVALFAVLGITGGYVLSSFSTETVQSSMMIVTNLISEDESRFLIDQLDGADSIQGLTREQEGQITRINYDVKKGEEINKSIPVYFKITTVITDKSVLPILQTAIINYLNGTEPIVRNRNEKAKFYKEMIEELDVELEALEKVKKEVDNKTKATFLDPSDLFVKSVELYDKKISYQIALNDIKSVHIVKGFGSLTKNATLSKTSYMAIGFLLGIILLFLVLFVEFFSQYYKQFEKATKN